VLSLLASAVRPRCHKEPPRGFKKRNFPVRLQASRQLQCPLQKTAVVAVWGGARTTGPPRRETRNAGRPAQHGTRSAHLLTAARGVARAPRRRGTAPREHAHARPARAARREDLAWDARRGGDAGGCRTAPSTPIHVTHADAAACGKKNDHKMQSSARAAAAVNAASSLLLKQRAACAPCLGLPPPASGTHGGGGAPRSRCSSWPSSGAAPTAHVSEQPARARRRTPSLPLISTLLTPCPPAPACRPPCPAAPPAAWRARA
jgi:hypothetical protein